MKALERAMMIPYSECDEVRLAIASTWRRPMNAASWLQHHSDLGVCKFFLFVTQGDDVSATIHEVNAEVEERPDLPFSYDFWDRQQEHVNSAIRKARLQGITHLLHIDDDELLYLPRGKSEFFKELKNVKHVSFELENWEARSSSESNNNPFEECFFFVDDTKKYNSYVNGKSIGCVQNKHLTCMGAHRFSGDCAKLQNGVVLHYEGMLKDKWVQKMMQYKSKNGVHQCKHGIIPFKTYCDVITGASDPEETWRRTKLALNTETRLRVVHPRFLEGSAVLIVGNGPSCRKKGKLIDSFPFVVRLNQFDISAAHEVGSKVDAWCVSDHVAVTMDPFANRSVGRILCIIGNSPFAHSGDVVSSCCPDHTDVIDSRIDFAVDPQGWLSTGLLAVYYFANMYPKSPVFIIGFDHFASGYHYEDEKFPSNGVQHNSLKERKFVDDLVHDTGRIFRVSLSE